MFQSLLNVIENTGMSGCRRGASTQRCVYFLSVTFFRSYFTFVFPYACMAFLSSFHVYGAQMYYSFVSIYDFLLSSYLHLFLSFLSLLHFLTFLPLSLLCLLIFFLFCNYFWLSLFIFFPFFLSFFFYTISRSVPDVAFCV